MMKKKSFSLAGIQRRNYRGEKEKRLGKERMAQPSQCEGLKDELWKRMRGRMQKWRI